VTLLTELRVTDRHLLDDAVRALAWSSTDRLLALGADGRARVGDSDRLTAPIGPDPISCAWVTVDRVAVVDGLSGVIIAGGGAVDVAPSATAVDISPASASGDAVPQEHCAVVTGTAGVSVVRANSRSDAPKMLIDTGPVRTAAHLGGTIWLVGGGTGLAVVDIALGCIDQRIELPGIVALAAAPRSGVVAAADCTGAIHVLEVARLDEGTTLTGYPDPVRHLGIDPDGRFVVAGADDELTWWAIDGHGAVATEPDCSIGHDSPITACEVAPSGLVATGDHDGLVRLWNPRLRDLPVSAHHVDGEITALQWSTWGDRLACGTVTGEVVVVDIVAGEVL